MPRKLPLSLKILVWLSFSVCFSLLPLLIKSINKGTLKLISKPSTERLPERSWFLELTYDGDLFLISAALSADAFGRALLTLFSGIAVVGVPAPAPWLTRRLYGLSILCVGCIVVLVPDALFFSHIALGHDYSFAMLQSAAKDHDFTKADSAIARTASESDSEASRSRWSAVFFGFAVVAGIGAIVGEED